VRGLHEIERQLDTASVLLVDRLPVDLLRDAATVKTARAEFVKATNGQEYKSPLSSDAKPTVFSAYRPVPSARSR
jgi:hypothetical protein